MVQSKLLLRQSSGTEGEQVWSCPGRTEGGKSTTEGIVGRIKCQGEPAVARKRGDGL